MYGLTDNIVAGPAGQIVAGPAGSFMAGPAGSFTPAPGGHTPVYPVTAGMPPSGAGYVPIDATPPHIPYSPGGGGVLQLSGSTQAPIPGPQANIPYSPATGGGSSSSTGGIMYMSSAGAGAGGGGAGAIFTAISGGGGGGGVSIAGGGGGGGGGGGVSIAGGGGGVSIGGGASAGGGGLVAGGGGISGGGASTGGGGVSPGANGGLAPSASTGSGGLSGGSGGGGGLSGGGTTGGGGGGLGGPGIPPVEMRTSLGTAPVTGATPVSPATPGNPVSPGGHVVPSPVGYLHPPPALRFHAPQHNRISRHPAHVQTHQTTTEAWQGFKPSYVWQGRDPADPPPPFLASDFLKPSPYEPPHLLFGDERVGVAMVDVNPGAHTSAGLQQGVTNNVVQDYSQVRNVEFTNNTYNDRNLVLDNSTTRMVEQNYPEYRQNTLNIVMPQVAAPPAQGLDPALAAILPPVLGGPVMARVA